MRREDIKEYITPKDDKGKAHGYHIDWWTTNNLACEGFYNHGKQIGLWIWYEYEDDGVVESKEYYV